MLRNYQEDMRGRIVRAWRTHRSVMVQMPTGTGKTHLLAAIIKAEGEAGGVWIVAHRRELVEQIRGMLVRYGVGRAPEVRVMSVQWLSRHWRDLEESPQLIVVDEAHHALAETYREIWRRFPEARKLGVTATPCRLDGRGFTDLFDVLLLADGIADFIREGWLSAFDYMAVREDSEDQRLVDSLVRRGADGDFLVKEMDAVLNRRSGIERLCEAVERYASGKKGIVYAVSISHARRIADCYNNKGISAVAIDCRTPARLRRRLVEDFRQGRVRVLVNVDVFSEGFDCPDVEFVQLARPTLSLSKYLQQVGRGLRKAEGKDGCLLMDHVGLFRRFGLPTACRDWKSAFRGRAMQGGRRLEDGKRGTGRGHMENMLDRACLSECLRLGAAGVDLDGGVLVLTDGHGTLSYVDPKNHARYAERPEVVRMGEVDLLRVGDTYYSRTRQPRSFWQGLHRYEFLWERFYLRICDHSALLPSGGRGGATHACYCILAADDEEVYTWGGRLSDGSVVVMDAAGNICCAEAGRAKAWQGRGDFEAAYARLSAEAAVRAAERRRVHGPDAGKGGEVAAEVCPGVRPFRAGTKWGLMAGGRVVVPPVYRSIRQPVGRYCAFEARPAQWGIIALDGRVVVEARYMHVEISPGGTAWLTLVPGNTRAVELHRGRV